MSKVTREEMLATIDDLQDMADYAPYWYRVKWGFPKEGAPISREKIDAIRRLIDDVEGLKKEATVILITYKDFIEQYDFPGRDILHKLCDYAYGGEGKK